MSDATADVQLVIQEPGLAAPRDGGVQIQGCSYLIELTADWIICRASENAHHFLGQSHVTLIDEPLGKFVHAQALHDLRNLFSRLSGSTGVARAYRVRLTDEHDRFDIAFQLVGGRVVLEAIPSSDEWVGQSLGTVGGLASGLAGLEGQMLLDGAARRMRALTGFDRVTLTWAGKRAESSRGGFSAPARALEELPPIVADCAGAPVSLFPRLPAGKGAAACAALLRAPSAAMLEGLYEQGVGAALSLPFTAAGKTGLFRADSRNARSADLEIHAAGELFAQMFAIRAETDGALAG